MGVELFLNWQENGEDKWFYVFKHSSYPYDLQDYDIPDETCPSNLDAKYLYSYLEWLKKLQFFIKFAPERYMEFNTTSNNIDTLKEGIKEDIINTQEAINKFELLKLKEIKSWISVG